VRRYPNLNTLISYTYRILKIDKVYKVIYLIIRNLVYNNRLSPRYNYRFYYEIIIKSFTSLKAAL